MPIFRAAQLYKSTTLSLCAHAHCLLYIKWFSCVSFDLQTGPAAAASPTARAVPVSLEGKGAQLDICV